LSFFYFFCSTKYTRVDSPHLIYTPKASSAQLFFNFIIFKKVSLFHFDKRIPFNFDLLNEMHLAWKLLINICLLFNLLFDLLLFYFINFWNIIIFLIWKIIILFWNRMNVEKMCFTWRAFSIAAISDDLRWDWGKFLGNTFLISHRIIIIIFYDCYLMII